MPSQDVIGAWMMKENGIPESSVKFSLHVDRLGSVPLKPLCYIGEDEDQVLVLVKDVKMLLVCNLKEQTKKVMLVNGDAIDFLDGCVLLKASSHREACVSEGKGTTLSTRWYIQILCRNLVELNGCALMFVVVVCVTYFCPM